MIQKECTNEKCGLQYYAERSSSKFCKPSCRTSQHKLDKKREQTLAKLQSSFSDEAERIDALDDYNLKNQLLDTAAICKNQNVIPLILGMVWSMNHSVTWQKQNKIDHLQLEINGLEKGLKQKEEQIDSLISGQKQVFSAIKNSLKENGVPLWQM